MAKAKTYKVLVELDVQIKDNSLIAHTEEGIVSAVRHAMRTFLPTTTYARGGYKFDPNTVHAELKPETTDV